MTHKIWYEKWKYKNPRIIVSAYSVPSEVDAIKTELMTNGPIEVAFSVYEDFMTYKSGI